MNTKIILSGLLIPPGIIFFGWSRLRSRESTPSSLITDPEFTGFKLVWTKPLYVQDNHSEHGCLLPKELADCAREAHHQLCDNFHPLDVFAASYPKSGTTWLSEVVFLLVNQLDWKTASTYNLEERVPYFEYVWPGPEKLKNKPIPRIIKTHLPFSHLPAKVQAGKAARIIYIVRDPRDVVVSFYHFTRCFVPSGYRNREGINGFTQRFLEDRLPYSPWSTHVQSYYSATTKKPNSNVNPKILIVQYENLKTDPGKVIRQIEQFLHDTWSSDDLPKPMKISDEQLTRLIQHCSFQAMSHNPQTNYSWLKQYGLWIPYTEFMRRGTIGDHRSFLSEEHSQAIEQMAIVSGLGWTLSQPTST